MRTGLYLGCLAVLAAGCQLEREGTDDWAGSASLVGGIEAESLTPPSGGSVFGDSTASGGKGVVYWRAGAATGTLSIASPASGVQIRVRGDQCNEAPYAKLLIDGVVIINVAVSSTSWTTFSGTGNFAAGAHSIRLEFPNDYYASGVCDRNLRADRIDFITAASPSPDMATVSAPDLATAPVVDLAIPPVSAQTGAIEAEAMTLTSGLAIFADSTASGGKGVNFWVNGTASGSVSLSGSTTQVVVRAKADACNGSPQAVLVLDGTNRLTATVSTTTWTDYVASVALAAGSHTVSVAFMNDYYASGVCDRNLRLDRVTFMGGSTSPGYDMAQPAQDLATAPPSDLATAPPSDLATVPAPDLAQPPSGTTIVIGVVGDINPGGVVGGNPGATAQNLRNMSPAFMLGLGDFQYTNGTLSAILAAFDKNFGALKPIIYPTAGPTHDVASAADQLGYKDYWGRDAFTPYSFDVGDWHIVQLPSAAYRYGVNTSGILTWLNNDLNANAKPCTLAFWHEPYWSRSTSAHPASNGIQTSAVKPWVDVLYQHGAELILSGHQHNYQRFAPMRPDSTADPNGVREFVVGSGGIGFYAFTSTAPNIEASTDNTYGALKLTLQSNGYTWQFIPNSAGGFTDSGSGGCH